MPTAMDIYKLLPKKNCGECKVPTCLAFAMQLANQKVALEACPYVSPEAKAALEESGAPPIKLVTVGVGDLAVKIGDETQLFRHDKTFYHPTLLAFVADDADGLEAMKAKISAAQATNFERVGQIIRVDAIALKHSTGRPEEYLEAVKVAAGGNQPMVLMSEDPKVMGDAVALCQGKRPLLYRATPPTLDAMVGLAKACSFPMVIGGAASLDELAQMSEKAKKAGVTDIVLEPPSSSASAMLENLTMIRRAAVKKKFRPLGYPTLTVIGNSELDLMRSALGIMKYSSVLLVKDVSREFLFPMMALRQNIFTDPQVPIQVKAGLYTIGEPNENSPVLLTTNFSLTYFTVRADAEKSRLPVWLLVVDTDGQSVMTAFAAGKLTPEAVAKAVATEKLKERNKRGDLIIPGMVSRMSGKLNELTELKIIVGPRESSGLPKMLKSLGS